ncbi:MAG: hypothetical protein ACREPN_03300 [Rudaea sp.]
MLRSSALVLRRDPVAPVLWLWLCAGLAACVCFPALRTHDPVFGWQPFWLVAAPLLDLVLLHRLRLLAVSRAFLVGARLVRARRRRRRAPQARRVQGWHSLRTTGTVRHRHAPA